MEVGILGPVEVWSGGPDGRRIEIEARKERAVIGCLALRPGRPVSPDTLISAVWGDSPPPTAAKTLQSYISKLRRLIGADTIRFGPAGYRLVVDGVDAERFEQKVTDGTEALAVGDVRTASSLLTEALELWRGDPLIDLADSDLRRGQATRLEELRLLAVERRVEAELGLGHHAAVVVDLVDLVAQHPLRESLWASQMIALYRSGRQADALRRYRHLRRILSDELGIDPSPALARLENRILRQDPALDLDPPPPPHNLPAPISTLIGREEETRSVAKLFHQHRLVSVLGSGGVGKTRLAIATARELLPVFGDGVWWVDLAAVSEGSSILPRLAAALGVQPSPGTELYDALAAHLRFRELLLVLDNCEHVVDDVAGVATRLLESGPSLCVLTTSRAPLAVAGEHRYRVEPLGVPPPQAALVETRLSDAVRLFTDRAEACTGAELTRDDLAPVAEICTRLDGLPLAIELAAARAPSMTTQEILARLEYRFELLSSGAGDGDRRHGSLRAVLDWSYEYLGETERRLFDRLAVFPATFDLAAVEAVGSGLGSEDEVVDAFGRLVDVSMVVSHDDGHGRRFRLLETLSEYGLGHLTGSELLASRGAHARHYRRIALAVQGQMETPAEVEARAVVEREDHNLRAAIGWSLAHEPRPVTLEFVPAVAAVWYVSGSFAEVVELCATVLDEDDGGGSRLRGWARYRMVWPAFLSGEAERARAANHGALAHARAVPDPVLEVLANFSEGHMIFLASGDVDAALPWYEEALAVCEEHGLTTVKVWPLANAAMALIAGDRELERARSMIAEAEALGREVGDDHRLAHVSLDRSFLAFSELDWIGAIEASEEMRRRSRRARNTMYEQVAMVCIGAARLGLGQLVEAESMLLSAARLALHDGNLLQVGPALQGLAGLAAVRGEMARAARLWGASSGLVGDWPLMTRGYERYLAAARAELGDRWDEECEIGRGMGIEEAVDLALDDD